MKVSKKLSYKISQVICVTSLTDNPIEEKLLAEFFKMKDNLLDCPYLELRFSVLNVNIRKSNLRKEEKTGSPV